MDLTEIEAHASELLTVATNVQEFPDLNTLSNVAFNRDQSWFIEPEKIRLNQRAFDLLIRAKYIQSSPSGYGYTVTEPAQIPEIVNFKEPWVDEWVAREEMLESFSKKRASSTTIIQQLKVQQWRQFEDVEILFHPRLTILTGANGSGKTTLLNILAPHFNWSAQLLSRNVTNRSNQFSEQNHLEIGEIIYSNGTRSPLVQYMSHGVSDAPISIPSIAPTEGLFINSHRSISTYQPLASLPSRFSEWHTLQQDFLSEIQIRYTGGSSRHSPLYRMKEALVAAAMYAYGNAAIRPSESAKELWEGYQTVLKRFLPQSLQFKHLEVDDAEIILVTEDSEFPLEAVSGGISAMFELSWQIFLRQRSHTAFTVCIDEPENHLHPELQRSIVPSLLTAFPDVTFIIATHSPLVVTSVQDAFVYTLGRTTNEKISSRQIMDINQSGTPDETLMSVLGLDTTLPIWAEKKLAALMKNLSPTPTVEEIRTFRDELKELGLDRQFPAAIRSLEKKQ